MPKQTSKVNRAKLLETYQQLPSTEKVLMQLCAVVYEPIQNADLIHCTGYLPQNIWPKSLSPKTLNDHINHLIQQQLLIKPRTKGARCHELIVELIMRELANNEMLMSFVIAVQKGKPISTRWRSGPPLIDSVDQLIRETRIGLYTQNYNYIEQAFDLLASFVSLDDDISFYDILHRIINNPFDADWFKPYRKS